MSFQSHHLREGMESQGIVLWRTAIYGTRDALEEVLTPGYFRNAPLREGDLVLVGIDQPEQVHHDRVRPAEVRRCLLMVTGRIPLGPTVRLVQDYGTIADGSADLLSPTPAMIERKVERPKAPELRTVAEAASERLSQR